MKTSRKLVKVKENLGERSLAVTLTLSLTVALAQLALPPPLAANLRENSWATN